MARRRNILEPAVQKPLLRLHAALDLTSFWKAIQGVTNVALPGSFVGLTLQHNPIMPMIAKWSHSIPGGNFNSTLLQDYFRAHPRRRFVRSSDIFPNMEKLEKSEFYQQYMEPQKRRYAIGLFFWRGQRLICVIVIMRTARQGELNPRQTKLLRQLYPHFQTALHRLGSLEREHSTRIALGEFLRRLPLPTILLRWNLTLVYQNRAAREFCALWEKGPKIARVLKADDPIPFEILEGCRALKKQLQEFPRADHATAGPGGEMVRHPSQPHLRATISLRQIRSAGIARPRFLVECEDFHSARSREQLPHMVRLSRREQDVTRLICDGGSNQEIANDAGLSLSMVKKHLHSVFRKLEITSRSQLMALMR
jgi:DNA-binding CsgD family transcriptional regulator